MNLPPYWLWQHWLAPATVLLYLLHWGLGGMILLPFLVLILIGK